MSRWTVVNFYGDKNRIQLQHDFTTSIRWQRTKFSSFFFSPLGLSPARPIAFNIVILSLLHIQSWIFSLSYTVGMALHFRYTRRFKISNFLRSVCWQRRHHLIKWKTLESASLILDVSTRHSFVAFFLFLYKFFLASYFLFPPHPAAKHTSEFPFRVNDVVREGISFLSLQLEMSQNSMRR